MNNLVINNLYIFSASDKKAKKITFSSGYNIVTSSKINGNKRGKSVILKSVYHALGADCFFDQKWDSKNKIYILDLIIKGNKYYIYRLDKLFKIFDQEYNILFKTTNRTKLSEYFETLYGFVIELPLRDNKKLVIAPPAYSYVLNFLDEDKMECTKFASFENLGQFANFKENLLYSHLGVYDRSYYELINRKLEENQKKIRNINEYKLIEEMIKKVNNDTENTNYMNEVSLLKLEIDKNKDNYIQILTTLNKTKNKLTKLRNDKYDFEKIIKNLKKELNYDGNELKDIYNYKCPTCKSIIEDNLKLKIKKYNKIEDINLLYNKIEIELLEIEKDINFNEEEYKTKLLILEKYDQQITNNVTNIKDVFKYRAYLELKNSLTDEYIYIKNIINDIEESIKSIDKEIKKYKELKNNINEKYYELMLESKQLFRLEELKESKFEKVNYTFEAGGSNKTLAAVIWHTNLLKVKGEFNPSAIKFPIIIDSPNNAEFDDEKRDTLFNYLFDNVEKETQYIVSTLGFNQNDYSKAKIDNIIELKSDKYTLLNDKDYEDNLYLLIKMNQNDSKS